jgi:hypothetical protein
MTKMPACQLVGRCKVAVSDSRKNFKTDCIEVIAQSFVANMPPFYVISDRTTRRKRSQNQTGGSVNNVG